MSRRGGARRGAGLKAGAPNRLALLAAPESRRGLALAPVRHHIVRGQREAALDDGAAALTEGFPESGVGGHPGPDAVGLGSAVSV